MAARDDFERLPVWGGCQAQAIFAGGASPLVLNILIALSTTIGVTMAGHRFKLATGLKGATVCVAFYSLAFLATFGQAETVFYQPPDPGIFAGTSSTLALDGTPPGRRVADDFSLPQVSLIGRVDWWGQHSPASSGDDDFTFTFYADASGLPGAKLLETRGTVFDFPSSIPELTEYSAILDSPFEAEHGQTFWLSIFNASPLAAWRWNNSTEGNNTSVNTFVPPDNQWQRTPGIFTDASFRLVAIPEPSSLVLLALGAVGIVARRRMAL